MPSFPNVESLLVAYLGARLGGRVATDVPAKLEQVLPLVRVVRAGGPDDGFNDFPRVDVEVFAGTRAQMWTAAENAREAMLDLAGRAVNGSLVDEVTTESGPFWLDYGNPAVHRAVATYRLTLRRR